MDVRFLTPLGALVGLAVLVPLAATALRERKLGPVRSALRLEPPRRTGGAVAAVVLFAFLAAAAAQPVLVRQEAVYARTDAEAFVLVDVSRSMLASETAAGPTRFERAVSLALGLRRELADVPTGVASMTDRPLPHLFPTADAGAFAAVVGRAIGVDRPPPAERQTLATDLGLLEALAKDNYFSGKAARRVVVLLTDGETHPFDARRVAGRLGRAGIGLVVVQVGSSDERVFAADGRPEPGYRPDHSAEADVERLAALTSGGQVFVERDAAGIAAAARAHLRRGPTVRAGETQIAEPLAGWLALAAAVPLALLLVPGVSRGSMRLRAAPRPRTGSPRSAS